MGFYIESYVFVLKSMVFYIESYSFGEGWNSLAIQVESVVVCFLLDWLIDILTTGDFKTGAKRYTVFMVDFPHTINSKTGTGILYQNL